MILFAVLMSLSVPDTVGALLPWPSLFPGALFAVLFLLHRIRTGGFTPASPGFGDCHLPDFRSLPLMKSFRDFIWSPLLPLAGLLGVSAAATAGGILTGSSGIVSTGCLLTAVIWFIAGTELINRRHLAVNLACGICLAGAILCTVTFRMNLPGSVFRFILIMLPLAAFLVIAGRTRTHKLVGILALITGAVRLILPGAGNINWHLTGSFSKGFTPLQITTVLLILWFSAAVLARIVRRLRRAGREYSVFLAAIAVVLCVTAGASMMDFASQVSGGIDDSAALLVTVAVAGAVSGNRLPVSPGSRRITGIAAAVIALLLAGLGLVSAGGSFFPA